MEKVFKRITSTLAVSQINNELIKIYNEFRYVMKTLIVA